ncbi:hypothetical protein P8452_07819 [Trifolium repens]|nr:hypothetical protein P8452_07819 [Trifolium repens]
MVLENICSAYFEEFDFGFGSIASIWSYEVVEVSTFEAFRHDNETTKFMHCIMDGTLGTIKGSCTVVRDFANICYYSYPSYLKERRECSDQCKTLR